MKLYYSPGACSLSPHIALLEAGLPYDLVKVDLRAKKLENGEDFLKVNPKGQVPALALDSGELVTEGPVIVQMIADQAAAVTPRSNRTAGHCVRRRRLRASKPTSGWQSSASHRPRSSARLRSWPCWPA